ncbi:MAG: putative zinc-binding metallopeptidase [Burkholderiaceae bacterium]
MKRLKAPIYRSAFRCQCGRPVFLANTQCINCGSQLGFETSLLTMVALAPGPAPWCWRVANRGDGALYRFCVNRQSASACNWLIPATDAYPSADLPDAPCLACRLDRRMFDVSTTLNQQRWRDLETAKRRLLSQLLALGLPVDVRAPGVQGIAFDLLEPQSGKPVLTGHHDGVITLNVAEADHTHREAARTAMHEPYRTLLGHFRHEIGHYYWDRLVRDDPARLASFRLLFGDERADYAKALQRHYLNGPPTHWALTFISSYASTHPWEDWAETWAHYLHIMDTVNTAASFGIDRDEVEYESESFETRHLWRADLPGAQDFLDLLNAWVQLTQVMNELSRSMGQPDSYPFVLPYRAVAKLQFIHDVVTASFRQRRDPPVQPPRPPQASPPPDPPGGAQRGIRSEAGAPPRAAG